MPALHNDGLLDKHACVLSFELQVPRVSQSQAAMGMIAERISNFTTTSISKRHAQAKMLRMCSLWQPAFDICLVTIDSKQEGKHTHTADNIPHITHYQIVAQQQPLPAKCDRTTELCA